MDDENRRKQVDAQYNLFRYAAEESRRLIGPIHDKRPSSLPPSLTDNVNPIRPETAFLPRHFGDQWDGTKRGLILADSLYQQLIKVDASGFIAAYQDLTRITRQALDRLNQPSVTFSLDKISQNAPFPRRQIPPNLERWLREQDLTINTSEGTLPDITQSFVIYPRENQHGFALEHRAVWWEDKGYKLAVRIPEHELDHFWNPKRVQFTIPRPYMLFCSGILRDKDWSQALADVLQSLMPPPEHRPAVIVIADGINSSIQFRDDAFFCLVLPAPDDKQVIMVNGTPTIIRPRLTEMAESFGCSVVSLWSEKLDSPPHIDWIATAADLKQAEAVLIDSNRSIMIPVSSEMSDTQDISADWYRRNILTLTLAPDDDPDAAEMQMRARLEAEEGVVGGGGAALCWLAEHLDTGEKETESIGRVREWLREAFQSPLRQMLTNAGIAPAQRDYITDWVAAGDRPTRSLLINTRLSDDPHFQVVEGAVPVTLGEASDLGVVSSVGEVRRIISQGITSAWQAALLYVSSKENPEEK